MLKLYVQAKSKRDLNRRLALGKPILGTQYAPWGADRYFLHTLNERATIVVYEHRQMGTPIAKAYGVYEPSKRKVK